MNVTYEGFYIVLSGLTLDRHELEEKNTDSALHSGVWVLRNLVTNEVITHTAFVKYALAEIPYNRLITKMLCVHAVRIPEKDIRLSVGAVNLSNLSQNYTASISASGLRYEFTDSVKNIHALGSTQDTYMHYRDSVLLPTRSGNPTFVSELTFSRGYEAIVFDEAAGTKNVYKNALFFPLVDMLNSTITP
jgi:hypothetical protein